MRPDSRLFILVMVSVAMLGCGQSAPSNATQASSNATPPPSNTTLPPVEVPAISSNSMLAEQKSVPAISQSLAPDHASGTTSQEAFEDDGLDPLPIESNALKEEARARQMEDRWLVLTDEERERLVAIKRMLVENSDMGITLTPADFLFVYQTDNEIFVERELHAAAAISCGPFIDFLNERLDWPRARGLEALGIFARTCAADFARKEGAQESCVRQVEAIHRQLERYGETTDGMPETLLRLGVLAEVLHQRNRDLTDEETVFLREMAPTALRKFLRLGLDPKNVHAREEAIRVANERELTEDREKLSAARDAAIKDIPLIVKHLESLYDKRERLRRADRETVAGNRARAETRQRIIDSEALLSRLVLDILSASDHSDVTFSAETNSLGPGPQKNLRSLTGRQKQTLLDSFPDNSDVRRFMKHLWESDRSTGDP